MIKYLGSKRTLLEPIVAAVASVHGATTVLDLFSGTSRVGHALKQAGFRVLANDHNAYAATLARCYVEADAGDLLDEASRLIAELQRLPGRAGYFTETFCQRSRYLQPFNGERVDAMREQIAAWSLPPELEAVLLVSLMEAADRVDSTTGVQMAFLKGWSPRSYNEISLRVPNLLPRARHGRGEAWQLDALDAARRARVDVAYVDPPYNQHSYLGNYHVWESLVTWDKPETYGIACKRIDVRQRRSGFNRATGYDALLGSLLAAIDARAIVLSFSNEGFVSRERIEAMLAMLWDGRARVGVHERDYARYVGARIGIHNPRGERVGQVSHVRNTERLYIARGPDA
jgi:adenine-specific DNA-methyltransferase